MATIGLFRSQLLTEQGQQVVKAIVVGDDLPAEMYEQFEAFLADDANHVIVLPEGVRVGWLG